MPGRGKAWVDECVECGMEMITGGHTENSLFCQVCGQGPMCSDCRPGHCCEGGIEGDA